MGYDTDDIRYAKRFRGTMSMIPTKFGRNTKFTVDPTLYILRNRIARYFNKTKNARRVAAHYDKVAASFMAIVKIASIRYWLRFVNAAEAKAARPACIRGAI